MPDPTPDPEPIDAEIVEPLIVPATTRPATSRPATSRPATSLPAAPLPTAAQSAAPPAPPDYDEHGVPSFDYVRAKIEGRAATGIGAAELAEHTAAARTIEQQEADRAAAATAKLDEIRRSLG